MAVVQLSDIYEPLVFNESVDEAAAELNVFLRSGVMVPSEVLSSMASVGGRIGELPFHAPLTAGEPDYASDDPTEFATPDKITTKKQIYRLASMHKSWSTMNLSRELALMDPLGAITTKIGGWWSTALQNRVLASARGILADNIANDSSDMVVDISNDSANAVADAERISAEAVLNAKQTMGDHAGALTTIAMHSTLYTRLQLQNLIDYIPTARAEVRIPTYLDYMVVVDDGMPVITGVNRLKFITMLFAGGAFDNGSGRLTIPSEIERIANAGNGGGQDVIHTRRSEIIHPYGFQFTSSSVAAESATLAELLTAANWDRVVARKKVGMAFLITNG